MKTSRPRPVAEDHLGLVYSLAAQIYRAVRGAAELDELVSCGTVGLLHAVQRFDPDRGVKFASFAHHRIRGAIWDGVRDLCRVSTKEYRRSGDAERPVVRSLDDRDHLALPGNEPPADVRCDSARMTRRLGAALHRLPARDRELLERHYWQEETLLDAGADLGVTKSWASRLHARALDRLREDLSEAA